MDYLIATAVVVLIVVGIIYSVVSANAEAAAKEAAAQSLLQRQEEWDQAQRRLALSCRKCHSLSPPIPGTNNRYRCEKCGNQFAAARHGQKERPSEQNPYPY